MFVRAVYTERTDMEKARTDALYYALKEKGYPDDFCREIAYKQMNTDYTATRMLGYLYRVSNPRPEDVVDEMLAILSDRNAIIQKTRSLSSFFIKNTPAAPRVVPTKGIKIPPITSLFIISFSSLLS